MHMQRLLAAAAAVGVASFACGKEKAPNDPSTEPNGCGKKSKPIQDPNTSSGGSSGYAVVDPMPPPAHCPDVAPNVKATATFEQGDGGKLVLKVHFPMPIGRSDWSYVKDSPPMTYTGALVASEVKADGVHVVVTPDLTGRNANVSVKGNCDKGPGTLSAMISWTGDPKPGMTANIYLAEY